MRTNDASKRKPDIADIEKTAYGIVHAILQQDGLDRDISAFETTTRKVNGKYYLFILDRLRKGFTYSCTPDEVCRNLQAVPACDLEGLNLIIFHQPKTREEMEDGSWGQVVYDYLHGNTVKPAIILEAVDTTRELRIEKTKNPCDREEIRLLIEEGHTITDMGRYYRMKSPMEAVRKTQLERTLYHEIGHYYDHMQGIAYNHQDKEEFANRYAKRMMERLRALTDG